MAEDDDRLDYATRRARELLDRARQRRAQPEVAGLVGVDTLLQGFEASLDCLERLKLRQERDRQAFDAVAKRVERLETHHDPRRVLLNGNGGLLPRDLKLIWSGVRFTVIALMTVVFGTIFVRAILTADSALLSAILGALS